MSLSSPPEVGFYTGGGISAEVPHLFPVAIDGRAYLIDLKSGAFKRQSIPLLRTQADQSNLPGEASLNPEDLWRRKQETWHHGAGQDFLDRPDSDPARFDASKGLDVWTKWQVSLLPEGVQEDPSANTNLDLAVAGDRLYMTDGNDIVYTTDLDSFTALTGIPANDPSSIASNGYDVWTAHGASGIYATDNTLGATSSYVTGTVSSVWYVMGRLMAAEGPALYNITVGGALPAALKTHDNSDWEWVDLTEGPGVIYAAGFSGDKSIIYRITIRPDGTALDEPIVAGKLPDGEIVRSIQGYLGFIVIGTDQGVRFAASDGAGNLTLGSLINTGTSVRCFEPQDRFIWFGWTNFDATDTGLGRLDLSIFTQPLTPAYSSDLMATTQGVVSAVVTFLDKRVFTVQGDGLWAEGTDKVASGYIETGKAVYGIPDLKVSMAVHIRHLALSGTVQALLSVDGGVYDDLGTGAAGSSTVTRLPTDTATGETFQTKLVLGRDGVDATLGPTLTRFTLLASPGPQRGEIFIVPLLLHEVLDVKGQERPMNPETEFNRLRQLVRDHRLVIYQEGYSSYQVFVEDYEWLVYNETLDGSFWNGTMVVKLKAVANILN